MTTTDKHVQAATILERSVCLTLTCHYLGNHRKVDLKDLVEAAAPDREAGTREVAVDEQQFHATKKLIDNRELAPVMRVFSVAKAQLRAKAIATHRVFGERSYLIPLQLVEHADADLTASATTLRAQAEALAYGRYESAVQRQREKLGPLFQTSDYLAPSAVAEAFAIDWSYVSFAAPEQLDVVSHALAMRAHQKHEDRLAAAYDEVVLMLRQDALDVVTDLERKLAPGDDLKPRVLRGTALRDLQTYLQYLPHRDLTEDHALVEAMARLATAANGLDVPSLRDSEALRSALQVVANETKATLAALVDEAPRRAMRFSLDGA